MNRILYDINKFLIVHKPEINELIQENNLQCSTYKSITQPFIFLRVIWHPFLLTTYPVFY